MSGVGRGLLHSRRVQSSHYSLIVTKPLGDVAVERQVALLDLVVMQGDFLRLEVYRVAPLGLGLELGLGLGLGLELRLPILERFTTHPNTSAGSLFSSPTVPLKSWTTCLTRALNMTASTARGREYPKMAVW